MTAAILLAAVVGVGGIPVTSAVQRFPDPRSWSGVGQQQVSSMLESIRESEGGWLRTIGPGPQQLLARWRAGTLTSEERVAVLLGGGTFHHPVLLPIYAEGLRSEDLRERKAAAVGLAWLLGETPPDISRIPEDPAVWRDGAQMVDLLAAETRHRSLVRIWADSFLAAKGFAVFGFAFRRDQRDCLIAIREIAQPEDVNEILYLWPFLDLSERVWTVGTLEIILVQRFKDVQKNPDGPSGGWLDMAGVNRVNALVDGLCESIDGTRYALGNMSRMYRGSAAPSGPVAIVAAPLLLDYPPMWIVPADLLVPYGARSVEFNRQRPDTPESEQLRRQIRDTFPVAKAEGAQPSRFRMPRRKRDPRTP